MRPLPAAALIATLVGPLACTEAPSATPATPGPEHPPDPNTLDPKGPTPKVAAAAPKMCAPEEFAAKAAADAALQYPLPPALTRADLFDGNKAKSAAQVLIGRSATLRGIDTGLAAKRVPHPGKVVAIYGPAGIGKSAVVRELAIHDGVCVFDLHRYRKGRVPTAPPRASTLDLAGRPLALLPDLVALTDKKDVGLGFFMGLELLTDEDGCPDPLAARALIFDGIDEITPQSAAMLLRMAADHAKQSEVQVIFVGRGEAFAGASDLVRAPLVPFRVDTPDAIAWYANVYKEYALNEVSVETLAQRVQGLLKATPALAAEMVSLEPVNAIFDRAAGGGPPEPGQALEAALTRAGRTNARPARGGPDYPVYRDALRSIAKAATPDANGWFAAPKGVKVAGLDGSCQPFAAGDVLAFSSLVEVDPWADGGARYRFFPAALQSELAGD